MNFLLKPTRFKIVLYSRLVVMDGLLLVHSRFSRVERINLIGGRFITVFATLFLEASHCHTRQEKYKMGLRCTSKAITDFEYTFPYRNPTVIFFVQSRFYTVICTGSI
jgi:hypothetical protein